MRGSARACHPITSYDGGHLLSTLEAKGYAKAVVLAGGLAAWKTANLPVETAVAPT